MKSTIGRPRRLTDEQVAEILAWHQKVVAWRAMGAELKSRRELAHEFGVAVSTITNVIVQRGRYKQPSPETREDERDERHQRVVRLRARGYL